MNLAFDPALEYEREKKELDAREKYHRNFGNLLFNESYRNFFELLWYSQLPCFDIENITSSAKDEISLVKRCFWKGHPMNCSSLFVMRPTDRGMCCSFNTENVEQTFKDSMYKTEIKRMQDQDKNHSFESSDLPTWYIDRNEPTSSPGQDKGLKLILDAHTDMISSGSVGDEFEGFMAIIDGTNNYPLASRNSLIIRPGRKTIVAMTASHVYGSEGTRKIDSAKRDCYFSDEYELDMHTKYSQTNCLLECQLKYTRKLLLNNSEGITDPSTNETYNASENLTESNLNGRNSDCSPWFYPSTDKHGTRWCDPWETRHFQKVMASVPDMECSYCLSDCNNTDYGFTVTSAPFRRCDRTNIGTSPLCNFKNSYMNPPIWNKQVENEYTVALGKDKVPEYIKPNQEKMANIRKYVISERDAASLTFQSELKENPYYDAFEKDISIVDFYFSKSTIMQFKRSERMTWVDYISQIGGLLGLAMGFSIISAIEIVYWVTIRLCRNVSSSKVSARRNKKEWATKIDSIEDKYQKAATYKAPE